MTKKNIPKLLVVFDTSVLFTQLASDLVRNNIRKIILENSNHPDLEINWYLPKIVVEERKYQMLGKARELLPSVNKLEKLLGHKLGIGEDTLELHVDKAINNSIEEIKFLTAGIDTHAVDWDNLINRSVRRDPPFEENAKEKGFRDSIIAQSFLQLQKQSPATPNICRLAFVSEDQLLRQYVSELTLEAKNVRILSSLNELESLINTLVSTISEEFAAELAEKAAKLFFEKENNKTFYYKENIGEKIREQYSEELSNTVIPDHYRSGGTWWISNPIFIKKDRQRIYWTTAIEPEFEIYHYESADPPQNTLLGIFEASSSTPTNKGLGLGINSTVSPPPSSIGLGIGQSLLSQPTPQKKVVDLKSRDIFEVHWSTNLSQAQNLTAPKLESIEYIGNNLADSSS